MSVAILRDTSFGNVLRTLESPSIHEGNNNNVNLCKVLGLPFYAPSSPHEYDDLRLAIRLFVQRCIFFNHEARRLRYRKDGVCEPITTEMLDYLESIGKVTGLPQLFMTLHCIDYNADIEDYLDREEGEKYPLQETFDEWHKTLQALAGNVAETIAWRKADEDGCEWF